MSVQRVVAVLVLSLLGFLPGAGLMADGTAQAPNLPACCRAHGKHKCAMHLVKNGPDSSSQQPVLYSVCGQYPFLPTATCAAANVPLFPPKDSARFQAAFVSHPGAKLESENWLSACLERGHLKRGPPAVLS